MFVAFYSVFYFYFYFYGVFLYLPFCDDSYLDDLEVGKRLRSTQAGRGIILSSNCDMFLLELIEMKHFEEVPHRLGLQGKREVKAIYGPKSFVSICTSRKHFKLVSDFLLSFILLS